MTAPTDTTDTPALYRRACEVMGLPIIDNSGGYFEIELPAGEGTVRYIPGECEWEIFGLIVAWIEARGKLTAHQSYRKGLTETLEYVEFEVYDLHSGYFVRHGKSSAPTLPLAAARWVVEHGAKIADKEQDT